MIKAYKEDCRKNKVWLHGVEYSEEHWSLLFGL
jgi:hypothetical protein